MKTHIEGLLDDREFFYRLFGEDPELIDLKREMLRKVWALFKEHFIRRVERENLFLISVPNRVEILGKHTDYQGGETIVLTGPKNFFAICGRAKDGISELMNADSAMGTTILRFEGEKPDLLCEGIGSQYTMTVAKRFLNNLSISSLPPPCAVKAVFLSDIPIGGGTSGSSSKVITDFLIFSSASGIYFERKFVELLRENAVKAGMLLNQPGVDDFLLPLSMYLAHYENGLDFGGLRGDRGVGTFGGSEDHTAILLGERDRLLYCRFCPTEVLERLQIPGSYSIVVAYSGIRAEKTKDAMEKYNLLSRTASEAVALLNQLTCSTYPYLRDFLQDLPPGEAAAAASKLLNASFGKPYIAERAYQFFEERNILYRAVDCLKKGKIEEFGRLINISHDLSRDYLKNIVPEIDFLQKSACSLGALGASGFGGGFGGCCYALVEQKNVPQFIREWKAAYLKQHPERLKEALFDFYPPCRGCYLEEISGT